MPSSRAEVAGAGRDVVLPRPALPVGDSLAVELPALDRAALVRIQVPQPRDFLCQKLRAQIAPSCGPCEPRRHRCYGWKADYLVIVAYGTSASLAVTRRHACFQACTMGGDGRLRLFVFAATSTLCSSLPADRRVRRISVGGLP